MIASRLTVRQASARFYLPAVPGLSPRTVRKLSHQWNRWERFTSNPPIQRITIETFAGFREKCLRVDLAHSTIEDVVSDVRTVLKLCQQSRVIASLPPPGRRLRRIQRLKYTPPLDDLSKVLAVCDPWWRLCLSAAYFLGLRRHDLLTTPIAMMRQESVSVTMRKTGRVVQIPVHSTLSRIVAACPVSVLGGVGSPKRMRRDLTRLCATAGVPRFTLQSIRRLSAQEWDDASPGCGTLVIGHRWAGSTGAYLNPLRALKRALPMLAVPHCLASKQARASESRMLKAYRRLNRQSSETAIQLVECLAR